jgi:hypothetical protein
MYDDAQSIRFAFTNVLLVFLLPAFPPHGEEQDQPVYIPDPWVGTQTYAEDCYAAGDVRTHPGQEMNPNLLEGTVRDDIGVLLASKIVVLDEQGSEGDPVEDEEQLEDELEHDKEAVIQPPTQHTFVPASRLARRALPIPAGTEFISIDDSDEETGSEDQEPMNLGPLKVVEEKFQDLQREDTDEPNMEREQSLEVEAFVREDTTNIHQSLPPRSEADISIVAGPLSSTSERQEGISMDNYESLYANIEVVTGQTEEQAGNYHFLFLFCYKNEH